MTGTAAYLAEICRFYVLLVLVAACLGKALAPAELATSIGEISSIRPRLARAAAIGVIVAEGLIALLLGAGGDSARAGMAAATSLFMVFAAAIAAVLIGGRAVRCNCFGAGGHLISAFDLLRNLVLIGACGFYLVQDDRAVAVDAVGFLLMLSVAAILFLVSTGVGEIAASIR